MNDIKWNGYLWADKKASQSSVESFERAHSINYPQDYKSVVKLHQGQVPVPSEIKVRDGITAETCLMHFEKEDIKNRSYSVEWNFNNLVEDVGGGVIPFAEALGGSVFAFDFRKSKENPTIIFINSDFEGEDAIIPVVNNFTEFMSRLYEPE